MTSYDEKYSIEYYKGYPYWIKSFKVAIEGAQTEIHNYILEYFDGKVPKIAVSLNKEEILRRIDAL